MGIIAELGHLVPRAKDVSRERWYTRVGQEAATESGGWTTLERLDGSIAVILLTDSVHQ